MNLTLFTDYSLRVLIYLATQEEKRLANIQEISDVYRISSNHLMKSVHKLGKLGLIETIRGRNGGIRLGKDPSEINIGWVVRQTEENWNLVECFDTENGSCVLDPSCRLKHVLRQALNAYLAVLDAYSLADLVVDHAALRRLFEQGRP
ncbi:Rrf2 family transcriptional regulator [Alicyclobacillus fodiniaquatilis]|uniref:HTH-type transcriptional regulator NsrR n=1 Tax=Alicyclobacillus fodiniaquatilis TaxID=1661150 RepID=A0ABW4JD65_9BACL